MTDTANYGRIFEVSVTPDKDGGFVAECPELGCVSQGETYAEAWNNIREAIAGAVANRAAEGW